jgi:TolB-like protein
MRGKILLSTILALGATTALADTPATSPSAPYAAAPSGAVAQAEPGVLVLPFQQTGDTSNYGWIAPALQEDLLGQVAQTGAFETISATQGVAGSDTNGALQAARNSGAAIVVFGGYQVVADQVRINAQVVDVASGRAVGALRATGAVTDLFKMEDSLSAQLHQILPTPPPSADLPTVTYGTPNAPLADASAAAPQAAAPAPYADNSYGDSSYYGAPYGYVPQTYYYPPVYVYPAYGYGYYCGPSIYFHYHYFPRYPGRVWASGGFHGGGSRLSVGGGGGGRR